MKSKDVAILGFAAALLGLLAYLWLSPGGLKQAPDVTFKTVTGEQVALAGLRGKPVLVTFWATTCPGCMEEMPHLIELHHALNGQGLEIVGVAMAYDPPNQVMTVIKQRKVPYHIALDIDSTVARAFGDVRLTPTTFLIAPDGRIVQQRVGELDMKRVQEQITAMLANT